MNENKTQVEELQKQILSGRKVLMSLENGEKMHVSIRYNNMDTDGTTPWRVVVNDVEYLTSDVKINIFTTTESVDIPDVGKKYRIGCMANKVIFENNIATID